MYAPDGEWDAKTPFFTYVKRMMLGVVLMRAGYEFGKWDATDEPLAKSKVVEYECEE